MSSAHMYMHAPLHGVLAGLTLSGQSTFSIGTLHAGYMLAVTGKVRGSHDCCFGLPLAIHFGWAQPNTSLTDALLPSFHPILSGLSQPRERDVPEVD